MATRSSSTRATRTLTEASVQEQVYADIIKCYMSNCPRDKQLKLVVIGESGQGKSTLINGLLGKEVATEGEEFEAGTVEIKYYTLDQNGISVQIWDTPGFGFGSEEDDEKMVEQLRSSDCFPHDLALFCFRMDGTRFPTRLHTDTVKKFTEVFGKKFWQHTVFILTFANNVSQLCPPDEELEEFFSHRVYTLEEKVQDMLRKKVVGLSEDEIKKVRAIPVGTYKKRHDQANPWELPDREDWFVWFWMECTEHMRQVSLRALIQANRHRIKIPVVNEVAPAFGEDLKPRQAHERSVSSPQYLSDSSTSENEEPSSQNMALEQPIPPNPVHEDVTQCTEASENLTAPPFARSIPIFDMLQRQLDNKDSSFYAYVKEYSKKRGQSLWVGGHIGGFIEGFFSWLGKSSRIKEIKNT